MASVPPTEPTSPAATPLAGSVADVPPEPVLAPTSPTTTPPAPTELALAREDEAVRYEANPAPATNGQPPEEDRPLYYAVRLPLILFVLSCISLFVTGCCRWVPHAVFGECWVGWTLDFTPLRRAILSQWPNGLLYMVSLLAILLAHEFGHFIFTVIYRVRATLPLVIPFPLSPFGTLGAVIAMEPGKANRRQIFDIGIAGPLAGLVVALPILWLGIQQIDFGQPPAGMLALKAPLLMEWMLQWLRPAEWKAAGGEIWMSQANPLVFAGWMGLFFTGLNMFPVGQLDGGHITYTLMGRGAHWLARGLMITAFAYMTYTGNTLLLLMALLVMLMGTDHPPTADDSVPLGWPRVLLGWASLIIPIVCLTPEPLIL